MAVSRDIATKAKKRTGGAQCIVFPSFFLKNIKKKILIQLAFKNKNKQVIPFIYWYKTDVTYQSDHCISNPLQREFLHLCFE